MSLEHEVGRIATALERIATVLENPLMAVSPKGKVTPVSPTVVPESAPKQPTSAIPGTETPRAGISSFTPPGIATPATTPVVTAPVAARVNAPSSPEELRLMAQKIAQKAGTKTLAFTQWVNELLIPYGVKTLVAVPAPKLTEVAVKLAEWAQKEGING